VAAPTESLFWICVMSVAADEHRAPRFSWHGVLSCRMVLPKPCEVMAQLSCRTLGDRVDGVLAGIGVFEAQFCL